jgi:uncharacterized membrane protein YkvA (DUF1232 family)
MDTDRRTAALRAVWEALVGPHRHGSPGIGLRLRAVPRMVAQGLSGRYPHLAKGRLVLAVLALVYIVSPVDAIPELVLPLVGLADDALVAAWLAGVLLSETDAFLDWERTQAQVVTGEVVTS